MHVQIHPQEEEDHLPSSATSTFVVGWCATVALIWLLCKCIRGSVLAFSDSPGKRKEQKKLLKNAITQELLHLRHLYKTMYMIVINLESPLEYCSQVIRLEYNKNNINKGNHFLQTVNSYWQVPFLLLYHEEKKSALNYITDRQSSSFYTDDHLTILKCSWSDLQHFRKEAFVSGVVIISPLLYYAQFQDLPERDIQIIIPQERYPCNFLNVPKVNNMFGSFCWC